ncbi:MAG: DUF6364 family protein [Gemmatimonadaceae bacterium]
MAATRTARRARNLSLTGEAIARGEAYSATHGTTLSALVEQFLRGLPELEPDDSAGEPAELRRTDIARVRERSSSPLVRDLAGLLADSEMGDEDLREAYAAHLLRRYDGR